MRAFANWDPRPALPKALLLHRESTARPGYANGPSLPPSKLRYTVLSAAICKRLAQTRRGYSFLCSLCKTLGEGCVRDPSAVKRTWKEWSATGRTITFKTSSQHSAKIFRLAKSCVFLHGFRFDSHSNALDEDAAEARERRNVREDATRPILCPPLGWRLDHVVDDH